MMTVDRLTEVHERREAIRIEGPFPIHLRGIDTTGMRFKEQTVVDNLSTIGVYMRLSRRIALSSSVFFLIRFAFLPLQAPGIAACGVVVRVERQSEESWGVAVMFTRHRFLYTLAP